MTSSADIRRAGPQDLDTITTLACALWPDNTPGDLAAELGPLLTDNEAAVFLAFSDDKAVGFAQCQLRHDYVEGASTSPVGYLEGIYVAEPHRHAGLARTLLAACEDWARRAGCAEFASDCELTNTVSQAFHHALGFIEANRIVCYTKQL